MGDGSYDSRSSSRANNSPANAPIQGRRAGSDPRFDSIANVFAGPTTSAGPATSTKSAAELHNDALSSVLAAAKAAVVHFSGQLASWSLELRDITSRAYSGGEAGYTPAINRVKQIFDQALAQAEYVRVQLVDVDQNDLKETLPEMKDLSAVYYANFDLVMNDALKWAHINDHDTNMDMKPLVKAFDKYAALFNGPIEESGARKGPTEAVTKLDATELSARFKAAQAAAESVVGGNSEDLGRMKNEIMYLSEWLGDNDAVRKTYQTQISALYTAFQSVYDKNPSRANELAGTYNQMLKLSGQKAKK